MGKLRMFMPRLIGTGLTQSPGDNDHRRRFRLNIRRGADATQQAS